MIIPKAELACNQRYAQLYIVFDTVHDISDRKTTGNCLNLIFTNPDSGSICIQPAYMHSRFNIYDRVNVMN